MATAAQTETMTALHAQTDAVTAPTGRLGLPAQAAR
jgi:hypothetical protein